MLYVLPHCALNHYVFGTEKMEQETEWWTRHQGGVMSGSVCVRVKYDECELVWVKYDVWVDYF